MADLSQIMDIKAPLSFAEKIMYAAEMVVPPAPSKQYLQYFIKYILTPDYINVLTTYYLIMCHSYTRLSRAACLPAALFACGKIILCKFSIFLDAHQEDSVSLLSAY